MNKKYELTDRTMKIGSSTELYQIKALKDIPKHGVKKGDLGGWIQSENNLSHKGSCWVSHNAHV